MLYSSARHAQLQILFRPINPIDIVQDYCHIPHCFCLTSSLTENGSRSHWFEQWKSISIYCTLETDQPPSFLPNWISSTSLPSDITNQVILARTSAGNKIASHWNKLPSKKNRNPTYVFQRVFLSYFKPGCRLFKFWRPSFQRKLLPTNFEYFDLPRKSMIGKWVKEKRTISTSLSKQCLSQMFTINVEWLCTAFTQFCNVA